MKITENFGFNVPENTDQIDIVNHLGTNWKQLDKALLGLGLDEADFNKIKEIIENANNEQLEEILKNLVLKDKNGKEYCVEVFTDDDYLEETLVIQSQVSDKSINVTDDYITNLETLVTTNEPNSKYGIGYLCYYDIETGDLKYKKEISGRVKLDSQVYNKVVPHPKEYDKYLAIAHENSRTNASLYSFGNVEILNTGSISQRNYNFELLYCPNYDKVFELMANDSLQVYNLNTNSTSVAPSSITQSRHIYGLFHSKTYLGNVNIGRIDALIKYNEAKKTFNYKLKSDINSPISIYSNVDSDTIYVGGADSSDKNIFHIDSISLGSSTSSHNQTIPSDDINNEATFEIDNRIDSTDLCLKYIDSEYILLIGKEQKTGTKVNDYFSFYLLDRVGRYLGKRSYLTNKFEENGRKKTDDIRVTRKNNHFVALSQNTDMFCISMKIKPENNIRFKEVK